MPMNLTMRGRAPALAFVVALGLILPASASVPSPAPVPGTQCRVFPANNVWNMDVSKLAVAKKSKVWKKSMHAGSTLLHPDFGPPAYGLPFDVVDQTHQTVHIDFGYADESDAGPYPFGPDIRIEDGSDRHALMIDEDTCTLYELYAAEWNGGNPSAGSGAIFHLDGSNANDLRPATWTSADAAGLPIFPGLVRWDEVSAGIRARDPVHGELHEPALPLAGAAPGRERRRSVSADGCSVPPEGRIRPVGIQWRRQGRYSRP